MTNYTLRTVPFRILRPALKLFPVLVSGLLAQVYTKTWGHQKLAVKIYALKLRTDALENPPRRKVVLHLTAWYGVAQELRDAVQESHPELARVLSDTIRENDWLEPSWQYMKGEMDKWVTSNSSKS